MDVVDLVGGELDEFFRRPARHFFVDSKSFRVLVVFQRFIDAFLVFVELRNRQRSFDRVVVAIYWSWVEIVFLHIQGIDLLWIASVDVLVGVKVDVFEFGEIEVVRIVLQKFIVGLWIKRWAAETFWKDDADGGKALFLDTAENRRVLNREE